MNDDGGTGRTSSAAPADVASAHADVDWLDEEEQQTWRAWLWGYRMVMQDLEVGLTDTGLRLAEYEILAMLSESSDHRLRMSALADLVVQSRSRLTHTAKRLEAMGLVQRAKSHGDGRGVEVTLTQAGHDVVLRVAPVHLKTVRRAFLDHLSREEVRGLGVSMRRVVQATRERSELGTDAP